MDAFYGNKTASSEKHQEDSRANILQEILVVLSTLKEAVSFRLSELTPHSLCSAKTRSIQVSKIFQLLIQNEGIWWR